MDAYHAGHNVGYLLIGTAVSVLIQESVRRRRDNAAAHVFLCIFPLREPTGPGKEINRMNTRGSSLCFMEKKRAWYNDRKAFLNFNSTYVQLYLPETKAPGAWYKDIKYIHTTFIPRINPRYRLKTCAVLTRRNQITIYDTRSPR